MNKRITEAFANGKAFIPFVTCGDPSLEVTEQLVYAMEEAGADQMCIRDRDLTSRNFFRENA